MNHEPNDVVGTASTQPSAPRRDATTRVPTGNTIATTLPLIEWGDHGAVLQPRSVPRYETVSTLGEGGMGEVVRARDNDIGREVAVKRLRHEHQHPELFARFVEEVRTVGQLEHPNIVPIHDAGLDDQGYFFVMKRVEGESLEAIIAKLDRGDRAAHARWPIERRLEIVRKVLEALRYAHSKGVVHRDIKPANILVGPMDEVFLLDWGIAKRQHEQTAGATTEGGRGETQLGAVIGTPLYMSPEQASGASVDARSDLYSLTVTLYELVTLKHPFGDLTDTAQVLESVRTKKMPFAFLVKHPHQAPATMDVSWLLTKGLAKDPAQRYQSADEMIRRMDDRAEGKVPIQCHLTATKRINYEVMRLVNRRPEIYSVLLVGLIAGAIYLLVR